MVVERMDVPRKPSSRFHYYNILFIRRCPRFSCRLNGGSAQALRVVNKRADTVVNCHRYVGRQDMKASLFYRIAAVLLLLFAVGHTLGFRQSDPRWGVDTLLGSMRSIHFDVQGFSRTYWDIFVAAGFSVGVFYLFAAILAWQLGGLQAETLVVMRVTVWALALCFAAITVVSWSYLFILPIIFSIVITVCLTAAAWLSAKPI